MIDISKINQGSIPAVSTNNTPQYHSLTLHSLPANGECSMEAFALGAMYNISCPSEGMRLASSITRPVAKRNAQYSQSHRGKTCMPHT